MCQVLVASKISAFQYECEVHEKCLCLLMSALFWNFEVQLLCQEASDHHGSLTMFDRHSMHYRSV